MIHLPVPRHDSCIPAWMNCLSGCCAWGDLTVKPNVVDKWKDENPTGSDREDGTQLAREKWDNHPTPPRTS